MFAIRKVTSILVNIVLGWMVLLALTQLILRWIFGFSYPWAELQLRQMVLIIALFGGVLAAVDNRHIRIDILEYYVKKSVNLFVNRLIFIIAAALMTVLTYISIDFIHGEREAGVVLRSFLFGVNMPQWYIELAIPVCFGMMSLIFLFKALLPFHATPEKGRS